jgi:methionine synthase II (cobalamin-independent)
VTESTTQQRQPSPPSRTVKDAEEKTHKEIAAFTTQPQPPSPADTVAASAQDAKLGEGKAQLRRQKTVNKEEFIARLKQFVNPDDPTKLYKNFVKVGQG